MDEANESEGKDDSMYIVNPETQRKYLRGRFLGQGAHASVYLVTDTTENINQQFAMKVMNLGRHSKESEATGLRKVRNREVKLSQVTREVEIHNLMRHKNVVRLESYFRDEFKFYIIMEHCELNNMAQLLRFRKRFSECESRIYLMQLLAGLQYIHDRGIIHRDLKPANIYLTQDMVLKIGDFGLADRVASNNRGICGTPNYISPEVLKDQGYTPAVDIWATGCITYHMVTGRPPFEADNQAATYDLIRCHRYSPIPPTQAGTALRHLVNWMLAFHPEERPSIPFIFAHAWMKKGHQKDRKSSNRKISLTSQKEQNCSAKVIPLEEALSGNTNYIKSSLETVIPKRDCNNKKSTLYWKNIFEGTIFGGAKTSLNKVLGNKTVFFHFKSKSRFCVSSSTGKPMRRVIEDVLRGVPIPADRSDDFFMKNYQFPVFVSKWIDYSNKYGFGYELTNGTCGVFFNDRSHMSINKEKKSISWCWKTRRINYHIQSVPNSLEEKVALLNYFIDYMDKYLSDDALNTCKCGSVRRTPTFIMQWMRNDKVILFEMVDGVVQVNFLRDHYKLVLFLEKSEVALCWPEKIEKFLSKWRKEKQGRWLRKRFKKAVASNEREPRQKNEKTWRSQQRAISVLAEIQTSARRSIPETFAFQRV